ncbi:hypothetical protein LCGC14_1834050, partial [marine sediment metagenome]
MRTILTLGVVAWVVAVLVVLTMARGEPGSASHCTTTVTAPSSIQAAIDAASSGDVVCLDDSGVFAQTVVFGPEDSGITLSAEDGDTPVMNGGSAALDAIRLLDEVSDVTIEGLTIQNYGADALTQPGNAIQAWDVNTSNITIRNNNMHGFSWNAVLVGSEGGFVHDNWMVKNNVVTDAAFVGIELTNCNICTIMKNDVDPTTIGIVVQARNTVVGSGLVTIDGVSVLHNTVTDASYAGIYVLSYTGVQTDPFDPIVGASILLTSVSVSHNTVTDADVMGIRFWAYNEGATAKNGRIMKNEVNCPETTPGIGVLERSTSGPPGTVENVKVVNN